MVTAKVCDELLPQALFAVTVMFPPNKPATVEILVVVDVPVHPLGKIQV